MMQAQVFIQAQTRTLHCQGHWLVTTIATLPRRASLNKIEPISGNWVISGRDLVQLDTAGAWQLQEYAQQLESAHSGTTVTFQHFTRAQLDLLTLVTDKVKLIDQRVDPPPTFNVIEMLGEFTWQSLKGIASFFGFLGELTIAGLQACRHPRRFPWIDFFNEIIQVGVKALLIVGLLSFLIGIVLAYQMGTELNTYGADIFIVELSGIAMLREFAPLMTAVIIAGRTSSSFAAQLGMMRFNAEIDALKTFGLSPMIQLVLPRILALLIVLPLLVYWADIFGVLGSMLMSKEMLDISPSFFLSRLREQVSFNSYLIGLFKTPVFALIIGVIGCFQGMNAYPSARSIGQQTTRSVVQAIFFIITSDALFSILFNWMDL